VSQNSEFSHRRAHRGQRGQVLVFLALTMTLLLGLVSLVVDFGMIYYDQSELNASTQAAVLAGAEAMALPGATTSSTTAAATAYSSVSGNKNAYSNLSNASMVSGYPKLSCLSTLQTTFGIQCYGPGNSNAIAVSQQATVPLFFARLFGLPSATLTATATASMRGSSNSPFNVAILVDSTRSMNDLDADSNCNNTRLSCAQSGVQVLLKSLSPCLSSQISCGTVTNGNVANSVDRVTLMTFPPVSTLTVANNYNCSGTSPTIVPYLTPFPLTSTYQVVDFSSDYRTSDTTSSLKSTSNLVTAVGGQSGCTGLQAIGGQGTYYAQAIYAAQAYLVAEKALYPTSKNVMVILSDGDSNATCSLSLLGICTLGPMIGASTTSGTYPSTVQQCNQAITAAQAATNAGTRVYTVAYGAASSGCGTDTSPSISPCQTMQSMASSTGYFFSDYTATGGSSSCISASQPVTNLNQIFQVIASDLTISKLIPNNTQ
jgi:hypothetical protein